MPTHKTYIKLISEQSIMMGIGKTTLVTAGVTIGILWAIKKFAPQYYPLA